MLISGDGFCYISGAFIKVRGIQFFLNACKKLCEVYEDYFKCPVRNVASKCCLQ